jgi:hypothetical protein
MQRITIRTMMIRIALLAGLLSILVPIAKNNGRLQHNGRLLQQADALIMSLASKCPPGVNPSIWTESVNTTQTIGANLYSSDTINTEEKERFNEDLAERLRGSVGPDIIPWIWSRYTRMAKGTNCESYVEHYRAVAGIP